MVTSYKHGLPTEGAAHGLCLADVMRLLPCYTEDRARIVDNADFVIKPRTNNGL